MQGEVSAKIAAVRVAAADLGSTETEIAAIAGKLPTGAQRAEIQALARARDRLQDAVQDTTRAYHDKVAALAELDRLIADLPATALDPGLDQALQDAQALNLPIAATKAADKVTAAAVTLASALAELKPWVGDAGHLRKIQPPTTDEIQRHISQRAEAETRVRSLREALNTKRLALARVQVAADNYRQQHDPVTDTTVTEQRQRRDAVWQDLRRGVESLAAGGDQYEQEVRSADQLADRRQREAATVERAETLDRDSRMLVAEIRNWRNRALPPPMYWRRSALTGPPNSPSANWVS